MLMVFCLVAGGDNSFSVEIDESESVDMRSRPRRPTGSSVMRLS